MNVHDKSFNQQKNSMKYIHGFVNGTNVQVLYTCRKFISADTVLTPILTIQSDWVIASLTKSCSRLLKKNLTIQCNIVTINTTKFLGKRINPHCPSLFLTPSHATVMCEMTGVKCKVKAVGNGCSLRV